MHARTLAALLAPTLLLGLLLVRGASQIPEAAAPSSPRAPGQAALPRPPDDFAATARRLMIEGLARGQAYSKLEELCRVAPRRLSGSPAAERAVTWAKAAMERDGLENVRLEPCMVPYWERGAPESLVIVKPARLAGRRVSCLALGGSIATPAGGVSAEVIEVQSFEELAERASEAAGKIVFFNRPMDPELVSYGRAYGGAVEQRSRGAVEAAKSGGVAAIVRSMTCRLDDLPHTGAMSYAESVPKLPAAAVSTVGAELISGLLAAGEPVELALSMHCVDHGLVPSFNVVGEIVGRELPEEIVLVGGHLDAWDVGQGAADDGGGCVHSMEALRLVKALGLRPRRTLRCVLFMNEENGLCGARAYAEAHAEELGRHVFALESDAGPFTPRSFGATTPEEALALLRELAAPLEEGGIQTVRAGGGGADLSPMQGSGVLTASFNPDGQRYFDLHHSERDRIEEISPRETNLGAGVIAGFLYQIADYPHAWPRNPPDAPADD